MTGSAGNVERKGTLPQNAEAKAQQKANEKTNKERTRTADHSLEWQRVMKSASVLGVWIVAPHHICEFKVSRDVYFVEKGMQKADVNLEIVVSPEHSNDVLNDNSEMSPKNELAEKKEEQSDESATSADENDDDDAVKIGPGRPSITRTETAAAAAAYNSQSISSKINNNSDFLDLAKHIPGA
ncbi:hypothetical protein ACLKA6_019936 [Drosophila palustris]